MAILQFVLHLSLTVAAPSCVISPNVNKLTVAIRCGVAKGDGREKLGMKRDR